MVEPGSVAGTPKTDGPSLVIMRGTFGPSPSRLDAGLPRAPQAMTPLRSLSMLLVLALVGCGEVNHAYNRPELSAPAAKAAGPGVAVMRKAFAPIASADAAKAPLPDHAAAAPVAAQPGTTSTGAGPAEISRKIIYDGQVDLV